MLLKNLIKGSQYNCLQPLSLADSCQRLASIRKVQMTAGWLEIILLTDAEQTQGLAEKCDFLLTTGL